MNAHVVPAPCTKCGQGHLQGPRYRKSLIGREVLVYTCDCCAFEQERETADAKKSSELKGRAW